MAQAKQEAPMPSSLADPKTPRFTLAALLWKNSVSEDVIKFYTDPKPDGKGCTSISDFAGIYTETNYEQKIETAVTGMEAHREDDLEVARTRVAWTVARCELTRALKRRAEDDEAVGPDWDTPLSSTEEQLRAEDFDTAYDRQLRLLLACCCCC